MIDTVNGDMWSYWGVADAVCITTNGFVTARGENVMGAGNAKQAKDKFPGIALHYGRGIQRNGHCVQIIPGTQGQLGAAKQTCLVGFPTKPSSFRISQMIDLSSVLPSYRDNFRVGSSVPGWMCFSSKQLIEKSCAELKGLADREQWTKIVLPFPGCGNGGLSVSDVMPILKRYFDDRFIIVSASQRTFGKWE